MEYEEFPHMPKMLPTLFTSQRKIILPEIQRY